MYGDADDPELPAALPLDGVRWIVSTVRRREVGLALLHALDHHGYTGRVALSAHRPSDAEALRARGADLVMRPYQAAAAYAATTLTHASDEPLPSPSAGRSAEPATQGRPGNA